MKKTQTRYEGKVEPLTKQILNIMSSSKQKAKELLDKPKYTNQKLWEMAKVITDKQKAATEIDLSKVDWNMLEESWYDWLEEELIENK